MEPTLKYRPECSGLLTRVRNPDRGHCQVGSFTGAVTSQNVTEVFKGSLTLVGHQRLSAIAQGSLTARQTCRAGTKVGDSDPAAPRGRAVAHRLKGTLGITG